MSSMQILVDLYKLDQEIQKAKLQQNYGYALKLLDEVIKIKQFFPNKLGLSKSIADKAYILEMCGLNKEALNYYFIAQKTANNTPNFHFLNEINNKINELSNNLV